jgi:hypothetical protein
MTNILFKLRLTFQNRRAYYIQNALCPLNTVLWSRSVDRYRCVVEVVWDARDCWAKVHFGAAKLCPASGHWLPWYQLKQDYESWMNMIQCWLSTRAPSGDKESKHKGISATNSECNATMPVLCCQLDAKLNTHKQVSSPRIMLEYLRK